MDDDESKTQMFRHASKHALEQGFGGVTIYDDSDTIIKENLSQVNNSELSLTFVQVGAKKNTNIEGVEQLPFDRVSEEILKRHLSYASVQTPEQERQLFRAFISLTEDSVYRDTLIAKKNAAYRK